MTTGQPLAALDVGSNTVRMLIAKPRDGQLEQLADISQFVRLGKGVDAAGLLQSDRMDAALDAIRALVSEARERGVADVVAVATSAVRDAGNGQEFARMVGDVTGVGLRILNGDDEARLTALGALMGVAVEGTAMVCDLGGGSAEFVLASRDSVTWGKSLPLGSGRLTERFVHHDPPHADEVAALERHVDVLLGTLPPANPQLGVFTGGTAAHVASLAGSNDEPTHMHTAELLHIRNTVNSLPARSVIAKYGVAPERAQVLAAGISALAAVVTHYNIDHVVITRHGIREGVLVDFLQREGTWQSNPK